MNKQFNFTRHNTHADGFWDYRASNSGDYHKIFTEPAPATINDLGKNLLRAPAPPTIKERFCFAGTGQSRSP